MSISRLTPVLYTADLPGTIDFYVQQLQFSRVNENAGADLAFVQCDGIELMITRPNAHMAFSQPLFTGSFYFTVTDVEAYWQRLKDSTRICYGPENFEYGMREFGVFDNNGYLLQFGQETDHPARQQ